MIKKIFSNFPFIAIALFLGLFYYYCGFHFGVGNNVEELPLIYKIAGFSEYSQDPFVQQSLSQFNAGSIFIYSFGFLASIVGINSMPYLYMVVHLFTLLLLCFSIISILRSLQVSSKHSFLMVLVALLLISNEWHLIPNQRSLFWNHLDPEFIVVTVLLSAISFFIKNKSATAAILLFIGTLLHPLYALPIGGSFVVISLFSFWKDKRKALLEASLYSLCILPYSFILWYLSCNSPETIYDASLLHEFVRAPHHLVIPSWGSGNVRHYLRFFGSLFFMFGLILFFWRKTTNINQGFFEFLIIKFKSTNIHGVSPLDKLSFILTLLILYLGLASFISSFVRISILVQLTPYRIGLFVTVLVVLILSYFINQFFIRHKKYKLSPWLYYLIPILIAILFFYDKQQGNIVNKENQLTVANWIKNNTSGEDLFLNYSKFDVRINCLRSDFFQFKTIPLNISGQIDWYDRLLIYYDIPKNIDSTNYREVAKARTNLNHLIDINKVLKKTTNFSPDFLLLGSNNQVQGVENYALVFENASYRIYKLP